MEQDARQDMVVIAKKVEKDQEAPTVWHFGPLPLGLGNQRRCSASKERRPVATNVM